MREKNLKTIIYLNGTSSSGKSTVAKALYPLLTDACHLSADEFDKEFAKIIDTKDPTYIAIKDSYDRILSRLSDKTLSISDQKRLFDQLYNVINTHPFPEYLNIDLKFYKHIREMAKKHSIILVDDLISTEFLYRKFLEAFKEYKVYLVKVYCPLKVLDQRERKRGDRIIGMASFWAKHPITNLNYDIEIDTNRYNPKECSRLVLDYIDKHPIPRAFEINYKRLIT